MSDWLIKGETVILVEQEATGETSNGFQICTATETPIDNVLIGSPSGSDANADSIYGQIPQYCLAIPKGDEHKWTGSYVKFWGETWKVLGVPSRTIDELTPGPWNMKVMVASADVEVG